jgi:Tautomerase enzyme
MPQTKVHGLKTHLNPIKALLSSLIHSCIVDALSYPAEKKFQRFFPMDPDDFYYSADRTDAYTIIEISLLEGRSIEAKKQLIRLLYERLATIGISGNDLEITIFENPDHNWGFRGLPGDEHQLNYKVTV